MTERWTRRHFLVGSGAAGALVWAGVACSDDDEDDATDEAPPRDRQVDDGRRDEEQSEEVVRASAVPAEAAIFGWISEVFGHGIRRPGYPADEWAEGWIAERFTELGLAQVRREPITVTRWEPTEWSLAVTDAGGTTTTLDCFPVPFSAPAQGLTTELAAFDQERPEGVAGRASLFDVPLITIPATLLATSGSAPDDVSGRIIDPDGTLEGASHTVPFGAEFLEVMEPSIEAGAVAFIGTLTDHPGDSAEYFVPYDAITRPIPGVWVNGTDGAWLRDQLARGPLTVRLDVASETEEVPSSNVVGELEGADDETVIIGSHHDGPWSSAVEDASGISLVLAQAAYWAAQPVERRPHRLVFLLQGGHMSGGAGLKGYIEAHRAELDQVVLEVHLEHAALEVDEVDGELRPTELAVPRWFFTSRNPRLEQAVTDALVAEELGRSMVVAPDAFGERPPTDGALYHQEGVPLVNFLAAPSYLFNSSDTLDKIDRAHLEPLTRAAVRIISSTAGVTAAEMRAGVIDSPG